MGVVYVNIRVSRNLKEEMAWVIDKWLRVIEEDVSEEDCVVYLLVSLPEPHNVLVTAHLKPMRMSQCLKSSQNIFCTRKGSYKRKVKIVKVYYHLQII